MIRGGDNNELLGVWEQKKVASIGWAKLENPKQYTDKAKFLSHADSVYPNDKPKARQSAANQVWRFAHEIGVEDRIMTYSKEKREYLVGTVEKSYRHDPAIVDPYYPKVIEVKWESTRVPRDRLSQSLKNSLGSTLTVFRIGSAESEFGAILNGTASAIVISPIGTPDPQMNSSDHLEGEILSLVQDAVDGLDPWQMQELVGGLLQAMGYEHVRVSSKGPDGGVDILASRDAFGFDKPVIKVQVKHRHSSAGAPEIQQLKGALPLDASALFVSTGGFSSKALQMANSNHVKTLDLEELVGLVIEWYEKIPGSVQGMLPLKKVYIPV